MPRQRKLIAGNWKMNGLRRDGEALARTLVERRTADGAGRFDLLLCPPATLIWPVAAVVAGSPVLLGGQDCAPEVKGAFTGDIAAPMLAEAGCRFVILGHSERRHGHRETDALIQAKAKTALAAGLAVILCVGETLDERERGDAEGVVGRQLDGSLPAAATAETVVIAYEPVWAIGTGRNAGAGDVAAMHAAIRERVKDRLDPGAVRILYGGSVKPDNARELLGLADVDGALVGGASLKADEFWAIATSS